MNDNLVPSQNAPTFAALAVAFVTSLINWLVSVIDAPGEVEATGAALLIALAAVVVGRLTQRFFTEPKLPPDLDGDDGLPHGDLDA